MNMGINAVSRDNNLDDDYDIDVAEGLFAPEVDDMENAGGEPGVASSDVVNNGELRMDGDDDVGMHEPIVVQAPAGLPSPPKPTAIEVALHWLTHLPYRSWCRWCVWVL